MPYKPESDENRKARRRLLYKHVLDSQRYMTDLSPYFSRSVATLQRVANGTTETPNKGTDLEIARFLRIEDDTLENFLSGKITFEYLCTRFGESKTIKKREVTVESVINDILALPVSKRLEILTMIAYSIQDKPVKEKENRMVLLTAEEKDGLKKIFNQSLSINEYTIDDIKGVSPSLLEYLESSPIEVDFSELDYLPLLPYLYRVQKWIEKKAGLIPMLDLEHTYENDLSGLLSDLSEVKSALLELTAEC